MNQKSNFQDGDTVSLPPIQFLPSPYSEKDTLELTGIVVHQNDVLGLLVRVNGVFFYHKDKKLNLHIYYLQNQIENVI